MRYIKHGRSQDPGPAETQKRVELGSQRPEAAADPQKMSIRQSQSFE
jgi:hypothetical protein